jgi:hypothetical protein
LSNDPNAKLAYHLLYEFVSPNNPQHIENTEIALNLRLNPLTQSVIRFLAGLVTDEADRETWSDYPIELEDAEPKHWGPLDVYRFRQDLRWLSLPSSQNPINPKVPRANPRVAASNDPPTTTL